MKNESESEYETSKIDNTKKNKCSICKCERLTINISRIKESQLKSLLSKIKNEDLNTQYLINKCKCSNNEQFVHKICLLLNIVFNFDLKCNICQSYYNINIEKISNNSKKIINIISFLLMTLFHIILFAASILLIIYVLKKDNCDFECKKYLHLYYFFGVILFIINLLLIILNYSNFINKYKVQSYDYLIDILDINAQNSINLTTDKFYSLLYNYYCDFYSSKIEYLINKKHKKLFFSSGYANFNKNIKLLINENNSSYKKNRKKISNNNIISLYKEQNMNIIINQNNNNNIKVKEKENFHYTGTLGNFSNNNKYSENRENSFEIKSKDTNPINQPVSIIKKNFEEDKFLKEDLINNKKIKNQNLKKINFKENNSNKSISIYTNRNHKIISKSVFYKKINIKNYMMKDWKSYRTISNRKKIFDDNIRIEYKNKLKNIIKVKKVNDSEIEKKCLDSTNLLKQDNENDKDKEKEKEK